jgi:hypothetical protein
LSSCSPARLTMQMPTCSKAGARGRGGREGGGLCRLRSAAGGPAQPRRRVLAALQPHLALLQVPDRGKAAAAARLPCREQEVAELRMFGG